MSGVFHGGVGCTHCLEAGVEPESLSFFSREPVFAVFARLVEMGQLPALCESRDGSCRVCWNGPADVSTEK